MSRSKVFSVLERIEKLSKEALCLVLQMCSLIEEALGDMTSCPSLLIPKCSLQRINRLWDFYRSKWHCSHYMQTHSCYYSSEGTKDDP